MYRGVILTKKKKLSKTAVIRKCWRPNWRKSREIHGLQLLTSPLDIVDACHDEPMTSFMQLVAYLFQGNNSQKVVMPEIFGGGKGIFKKSVLVILHISLSRSFFYNRANGILFGHFIPSFTQVFEWTLKYICPLVSNDHWKVCLQCSYSK